MPGTRIPGKRHYTDAEIKAAALKVGFLLFKIKELMRPERRDVHELKRFKEEYDVNGFVHELNCMHNARVSFEALNLDKQCGKRILDEFLTAAA